MTMRSLNVYLAWLFLTALLCGFLLSLPLMLAVTALSRAMPFLLPYAAVLPYPTIGVLALAVPAWCWRTRGLLPAVVTPRRERRLARGERMLRFGHVLFLVVLTGAVVMPNMSDLNAYFWMPVATMVAVPLCLGLWVVGLYHVVTSGTWITRGGTYASRIARSSSGIGPA